MKAREVIKKLRQAGFSFSEGANPANVLDATARLVTQIPRHARDLKPGTLGAISKATGVKLS
jgi:predicted RNA binding protein YcfA (HicA-like mRNA interferase family)